MVHIRPRVVRPGRKLTVRYLVSEPAQVSIYIGATRVVRGRTSKTSAALNWYGAAAGAPHGLRPGTYRLELVARDVAGNISSPAGAVRMAGLAAWAAGALVLALYLVPSGHHPALGAATVFGVVSAIGLALLLRRWPWALPVLALACVPARIPVHVGGTDANLLVPL